MAPPIERSRLSAAELLRWKGLPLSYVDTNPKLVLNCAGASTPMLCMLDGARGLFEVGREAIDLLPGSLGLFVPEAFTGHKRLRCTPGRRIAVQLDLGLLRRKGLVDDDLVVSEMRSKASFYDADLSAVLRLMASEISQGCPNGTLLAESLSLGVLLRLAETHAAQRQRTERGVLTAAQVRRLDELIEAQLANDISLSALAAAVGFSKPHFTRLFRNSFGMPAHQYLVRKRVMAARQLIAENRLPLAQIAAHTGFASQSHMTAAFNRVLRSTPGEIRRATGSR